MLMISTMIIMIILIHEEIYSLSQQGFKGQFQDWMLIFFTRSPNWSTSIESLASIYLPLMLMSRVVGPQVRASPHSYSPVDPEISNPFHPTPSRAFMQQLERERSRSRSRKVSTSRRCISSAAAVQSTTFNQDGLSNTTESDAGVPLLYPRSLLLSLSLSPTLSVSLLSAFSSQR